MAGNDCSDGGVISPAQATVVVWRGAGVGNGTWQCCAYQSCQCGHRDGDEKSLTYGRMMARTVGWPDPSGGWRGDSPSIHTGRGGGGGHATVTASPRNVGVSGFLAGRVPCGSTRAGGQGGKGKRGGSLVWGSRAGGGRAVGSAAGRRDDTLCVVSPRARRLSSAGTRAMSPRSGRDFRQAQPGCA